jgi:hypothetical protein
VAFLLQLFQFLFDLLCDALAANFDAIVGVEVAVALGD